MDIQLHKQESSARCLSGKHMRLLYPTMTQGLNTSLILSFLSVALSCEAYANDLATSLKFLESGIEITIHKSPQGPTLKLARFNNPIKSVVLKQEEQETALAIQPYPTHWEIDLGKNRNLAGSTVMIETQGKPMRAGKAMVAMPDDTGTVALHASQAITVGERLRYEPQPSKNTLGYWTQPKDYPEWLLQVAKPGKYRVVIHQACGRDQDGSSAEVRVGEESIWFKVKDTKSFQNFEAHRVGTIKIASTEPQSLKIHITRLRKTAAMDLRLVELIPIN